MAFDTSFLTRKVGPLPVWVYAVGAGAGVYLLYARGQKALSSQQDQSQASSPFASSAQGQLNYPPTVVVTPGQATNTVSGSSSGQTISPPGHVVLTARPGYRNNQVSIWAAPTIASSQIAQVASGTTVPAAGAIVQGGNFGPFNDATGNQVPASSSWQPVSYNGQTGYVWAPDAVPTGGSGGGGGGTLRTMRLGISHLQYATPFQPSQYVNGRGFGGVHGVARATRIPVHRLQALNYHLRRGDGSYGSGIVRVA